jgi:hypothetical protein
VRAADERLLHAAEKGDVAAAQAALDEGADPLAHVLGTMTALHVAAKDGKTKVVRFLLEKAPYDSMLLRDVHFVARGSVRGREEVVELIEAAIEDADRRQRNLPPVERPARAPFVPRTLRGALLFAIHEDDVQAARAAIANGADANQADDEGFTPLMAAARSGDLALVELLLDAGADPLPRYIGGNRASDLADQARYYELAEVLWRAEVVADLKAPRTYLNNFTHEIGGRTGEEKFIFYAGGRFFHACWVTAEKRLGEVRWWDEAEFRQVLSHGQYGASARQFFGDYNEIPEKVLREAPARAERSEEILRRLEGGRLQLVLTRSWREKATPRWYVRRHDSQWLLVMGADLTPITAERARSEVEETLREPPEAELVPVDAAASRRAATAVKSARTALRRLLAGAVWVDGNQLHFAVNGRLYFGLRKGKRGALESAAEQPEDTIFDDLFRAYSRRGRPQIAAEPRVHKQAAPLVDEGGLLARLEAGQVALGWRDARLYLGEDGKMMKFGASSSREVSPSELLEILRTKRYAWVERRVEKRARPR